MSLLEEFMDDCVIINKVIINDEYGGYKTDWTEGAQFEAAITLDTSMEARIGDKQGVTALYTVTTNKALNLQYHDVIKRVEDGKIFRITSDGDDKHTPGSATINMRQVTAEEWELPVGN